MTENIKLIPAYVFDTEGYFDGETMWQVVNGETIEAPGSTTLCPWGEGECDTSVFYRFNGEAWVTEKKPACAAELVGVVVSHTSTTLHDGEMRELVQKFSDAEGYRQVRGDDLSWSIDKIPEKTLEEKRKEAEEQVRAERDRLLGDSMWMLQRHQSEKQLGRPTTLSEEEFLGLLQYQQDLRDVPQQSGFPENVEWPVKPACIK